MKKTAFYSSLALVLAAFGALLYAPAEAAAGAVRGLRVCAGIIIPSLFPFLVLSGLLSALGLPRILSNAAGPLLAKLFGVSGAAAPPFLLGLTGGYPVGAASTAELIRRGELSAEEGTYILPFCNNTGPAFIIGAAGAGVFGSTAAGLLLYLSHILAAVAVGALFSIGTPRKPAKKLKEALAMTSLPEILPACVKNSVSATLHICGFVVFFSVVTALLEALGIFSSAAGWLAAQLNMELHFSRALLTGILELGSGISALSGLPPAPKNLALASFILGFGGLSVHCQTLAVTAGTGIRNARHFAGRLLHGAVSAGLTFLLAVCFTA